MEKEDLRSIDGMDEKTAEKLSLAGITSANALAATPVVKLVELGIHKSVAVKITGEASKVSIFGPKTGDALIQESKDRQHMTSGTRGLDVLLGGKGFESQTVYEIYGPEGVGKSTLLHQLVCTACLPPDKGGLGTGTVYIDTERSFSIRKVEQIAQRFGISPPTIRQNIIKITPPISDVLVYFCENLLERVAEESGARLFLLDSLATHFRAEYGTDPSAIPERQAKAKSIIESLISIAKILNGVAIYTNQETVDAIGYGKPKKHAMGFLIGHAARVRIRVQLANTSPKVRMFQIEKAVDLPKGSCQLELTPAGFDDL